MESLNGQIQAAIKNIEFNRNGVKQYRIMDNDGLVYSKFLGWVKLEGRVYGHNFDEKELPIVLAILKEHGYHNIHTKLDKTATLFITSANSPFGNPSKMGTLLLFTAVFFIALFIMVKFNLFEFVLELIKKSKEKG